MSETTALQATAAEAGRVDPVVRHPANYKVLSDDYINSLFDGTNFGEPVNSDLDAKRMLIAKTLRCQLAGYWAGHTIYWICVHGGFLQDAKTTAPKKLTALGHAYLAEFGWA